MIRINEPPTDYRIYLPFGYSIDTGVGDPGSFANAVLTEGLGKEFLLDEFGMRVTAEVSHGMVVGSPEYHAVAFYCPEAWDSAQPVILSTGATIPAQLYVKIEIDDAELTVQPNCDWTFSFSELRVYLDTGSGYVLKHTIGATSQADEGFDKRLNSWDCVVSAGPAVMDLPGAPTCDMVAFNDQASGIVDGPMWERRLSSADPGDPWLTDDILIDDDLAPSSTDPACDCVKSLPDVNGTDSGDIHLEAYWLDGLTITDNGIKSCPCVSGGTSSWHEYVYTRTWQLASSSIQAVAKDAGIRTVLKETSAICNETDITETSEEVDTSPDTLCAMERNIQAAEGVITCVTGLTICFETDPVTGEIIQCYEEPGPASYCTYAGQVQITWPYHPGCGTGGTTPTYDVSFGNRHYRGFIAESGEVYVGYADNTLGASWVDQATGITADWVHLRVDRAEKQATIYLYTEESGSVNERTSTSEGATFSMATTIATGEKPAAIIGRNGFRYIYWADGTDVKGQIRDRANNVVEATFTAYSGIDSGTSIAVDESTKTGGEHRLVMLVVVSGAITEIQSSNGKTFS